MKKADIDVLANENVFDLIGKQWMLVTAAASTDSQCELDRKTTNFNTMTASWGGIGWLWGKPVAFIFIRPERYTHDFIEKSDRVTLSFYEEEYRKALQLCGSKSGRDIDKVEATGLTPAELESGAMTFSEARMTLDCRKLFKSAMRPEHFLDKSVLERWYNDKPGGGLHDVYVLEIEEVYTR